MEFLLCVVENIRLTYSIMTVLIILLAVGIVLELYRLTLSSTDRGQCDKETGLNGVKADSNASHSDNADRGVASDIADIDDGVTADSGDNGRWLDLNDDGDTDVSYLKDIRTGEAVKVSYRRSFVSRLMQADETVQQYYDELKNYLLAFKCVKSRLSTFYDSFNKGRIQVAKLKMRGRVLSMYIALNPQDYTENKYHFIDESDKKKYQKVPMCLLIKSDLELRYAKELIDRCMAKFDIDRIDREKKNYRFAYMDDNALIKKGLIKVYINDKPSGIGELSSLLVQRESIRNKKVG